jgi:hypothetical protein
MYPTLLEATKLMDGRCWLLFGRAAGLVYALRPWFRVGQERTIIDKKTGQQRKISMEAEFFFVPARYWPVVLMALGLAFFFYNAHRSA